MPLWGDKHSNNSATGIWHQIISLTCTLVPSKIGSGGSPWLRSGFGIICYAIHHMERFEGPPQKMIHLGFFWRFGVRGLMGKCSKMPKIGAFVFVFQKWKRVLARETQFFDEKYWKHTTRLPQEYNLVFPRLLPLFAYFRSFLGPIWGTLKNRDPRTELDTRLDLFLSKKQ